MPNSSMDLEMFDPVPCLIAHARPAEELRPVHHQGLFRLIMMGWLTVSHVRLNLHPHEYAALAQHNDRPDEQQYPFVVVPLDRSIPSSSQRIRLHRRAGLGSHPDDVPDIEFFGYSPTGFSDDKGEGEEEGPHPPIPIPVVIPILLPRLRKRRRGRQWSKLRRWSKSTSRNAGRSRIQLRREAIRNRNFCEGTLRSVRILRSRFRISERAFLLVNPNSILSFLLLFVLFRCCKFY